MEFFERAHVVKSKITTRKESKSEENVKKQLKKMLYGYKQSDNELIKTSANLNSDFDDSTSVSGFSDLNLTNSSIEGDVMREIVTSKDYDVSLFDVNELSLSESKNIMENDNNENENQSVSNESISEYNSNIQSLSEDMPSEIHNNISVESDDISLNSSLILETTDAESDYLDSFDVDGALAAKILTKLNKMEKTNQKKEKKRKLDEVGTNVVQNSPAKNKKEFKGPFKPRHSEEIDNNDISDVSSYRDYMKFRGPYRPQREASNTDSTKNESKSGDNLSQNSDTGSAEPFVSVMAIDMPNQSLNEILGEYRYSTVKNLPSDSQHIVTVMHNCSLFSTEDISVEDIHIEEDVDSLIPEIDNELTLDDIDLVATELDASTDLPKDERFDEIVDSATNLLVDDNNIYDNTMETSITNNDESTLYDQTLQSEEVSEKEQSTESAELNPVRVYYTKNCCIFVLKHPAHVFIHGKVKVKAFGGTVEVLGYTLKDEPCEIYAPNYNYAQCLKTVENQNTYYGLFGKLTSTGLSVAEAEDIVTTLGEYDGVVSLVPLKTRKMEFVENNFTVADLFSKPSKNIESCFKKACEMLGCSLYLSKPWKCFEENVTWKLPIRYVLTSKEKSTQSRGIVCGGKGTGKSTFLRYYVNKLLAQGPVLVVDLDPGQCEFTPAGNVAATVVTEPLLGPNFTHLMTPDMMLNLGMINTMDNPRRYATAVETLITHCSTDERLQNMPWIINTMGMCNAMGLKFISLIILRTRPTFLLQIDSNNAKKRFSCNLYPQTISNLFLEDYQTDYLFRNITLTENFDYSFFISHHTVNMVKNNFSLAPRDERYLNYLAYFGELNVRKGGLLGITPYEVNLKDLSTGMNVKIDKDAVTQVINGKIIALCQHTQDSRKVFTLGDKPLLCHGHGLVRGIDWEREVLYIITPMPVTSLASVNAVVYADWAPELRGQERQVPAGAPVPYRTATAYHQRQLMFAPRRRFNPLQLLKMSRSA